MTVRDIIFRLRGQDDLTPAVRRGEQSLRSLEDAAQDAGDEIDKIDDKEIKPEVDSSGLDKLKDGLDGVASASGTARGGAGAVGGLGGLVAAGNRLKSSLLGPLGVVAGIIALGNKTADTNLELGRLAASTGLSLPLLRDMRDVVNPLGGDVDDVAEAFKTMAENIVEANAGEAAALELFDALNLDFRELLDLSPDEQFTAITNALIAIEDPTKRAAIANRFFSNDLTDVLAAADLAQESIEGLRRQFQDRPPITQADIEAAIRFNQQLSELAAEAQDVAQVAVPPLVAALKGLSATLEATRQAGGFLARTLGDLGVPGFDATSERASGPTNEELLRREGYYRDENGFIVPIGSPPSSSPPREPRPPVSGRGYQGPSGGSINRFADRPSELQGQTIVLVPPPVTLEQRGEIVGEDVNREEDRTSRYNRGPGGRFG